MRPRPHVSFVITARNESPPVLARTLNGLFETSSAFSREVVVVDDASTDPVIVERDVTVVRHPTARGVCRSRRSGAAVARGDLLCWVDSHMSFEEGWLEEMVAGTDAGALVCAAWADYDTLEPLCFGADFSWCNERDYARRLSPGLAFEHRLEPPRTALDEVPMIIGACYAMLRDAYDAIGGFSPFFGTWGKAEEDISARAWLLGNGVRCAARAHVGHLSYPRLEYPASWTHVEFNQLVMIHSIFDETTLPVAVAALQPLPGRVHEWVSRLDLSRWRAFIASRRRLTDLEFLERFVPGAPPDLLAAAAA